MARTRQDTHTVQLWPGGESVTYRGDVDGPEGRRSLRTERPEHPKRLHGQCPVCQHFGDDCTGGPKWRKGTPEEWTAIRREVRAERIQAHEVLCCDSGLVTELVRLVARGDGRGDWPDLAEAFEYDQIRNLYADPDGWTGDQCLTWLYEQTGERNYADRAGRGWDNEVAAFARHEGYTEGDKYWDQYVEEQTQELRDGVREYSQDHPAEVYEWWRVSQWLCDQLHAIGEVTIDNGYGCWWGRTCTGQGMIMDGTLQAVAKHAFEGGE